jgi:alpha-mannosidase
MPTIVSRAGVTRYYMCRGGKDEKPPLFWWRGPDGSQILVNLETTWYLKAVGPENAMAALRFAEKTGLRHWMNVYGVGDHGGGPTRRDILRCRDMDSWPIFPRFRFSTTRDFYAVVEREADKLPVLDRELNFEFTGCYTSQSQIKRHNRLGEARAQDAEAAAVLATRIAGVPYPVDRLREAWTRVLFGHFHDILPGSGVRATREYQSGLFQQSAADFGTVQTLSLRAVAAAIDTSFAKDRLLPATPGQDRALGAGVGRGSELGMVPQGVHQADGPRPVVVFNPLAFPREELVKVAVWDSGSGTESDARRRRFVVHTPEGRTVPAEIVAAGNYWGHGFVEVVFPVSVGALGYAAYVIEERAADHAHLRTVKADPDALVFENDFLLARFDRLTGGVRELVSKATGADVASPDEPLALLELVMERPRGMSAWSIGDTMSRIHPLEVHSLVADTKNPYLATLVAKAKLRQSELTVTYSLKAGQSWLDVGIDASWLERGGPDVGTPQLRMRFPTRLENARARYEIPYGTIVRDLSKGEEVPALRFADAFGSLRGEPAGLLVLNDSKHGHSLDGATLAITLIRSSYEPDPLPEIGAHSIRLALVPHGRAMTVADMTRLGAAFNHPLQVVPTDLHAGRLGPARSAFASVSPPGVVVTAVKRAETDGALILRLLETEGKACTASVGFDAEILGKLAGVEEVDLLERSVPAGTARLSGQSASVGIKAHGLSSVKLRLE